jgi:concanavalin A-like lectin/glucanase superfamily protein
MSTCQIKTYDMKKNGFIFCLLFCLGLITTANAQNTAVVFDGPNDYVDLGNNALLNANTIRTMECWVMFTSLSGSQEILSKSMGGQGIELLLFGGNLAAYYMNGAATSYITYSTSNLVVGRWYHIATAWDGIKENIKLYVNGASVGILTHVGDVTATGISNTASSFKIGQWSDPENRALLGTVDEVRIWNVNRTAVQIKQNMFTIAPNTTGLVAYYKADEGSGTTLINSTANAGLNGTLTNGPTYTPSQVQFNNNALEIDGADDYVTIPGNSAYDFTTGTVEFMVKPTTLNPLVNAAMLGNRGTGGTRYSFHITPTTLGFFNGTYQTLATTFSTGTWYHLAFVMSGSSTTAYVNGTLLGTYSLGAGAGTLQTFIIGRVKELTEYEPFNGAIDEVRIWNTARTQTQINTYKNVYMTGTEAGLVGLFNFNQGFATGTNTGLTVAQDYSSLSNNGTLVNFALSSTASNYVASPLVSLPVTYAGFVATKNGSSTVLQWQTQQEENSKSFIIERGTDGKEFTGIGEVTAAGNSSLMQSYSFTDETPAQGRNYYRLNQVDLDGRSNYSAIRTVDFTATAKLSWYATGNAIQVILEDGNNEQYQLVDMRGSIVQKGRLTNGRIRFNGLRSGTYSIQVQTASPIRTLFVVK